MRVSSYLKITALCFLGTILLNLAVIMIFTLESPLWDMDDGWEVKNNSEYLGTVAADNVTDALGITLDAGEILILSTTLPDRSYNTPAFCLTTNDCAIEVYLGDRMVDSFGTESLVTGDYLGDAIHFVSLPLDCGGKTLRLIIRSRNNGRRGMVYNTWMGNYMDLQRGVFRNFAMPMMLGTMSCALGTIALISSTFFSIRNRQFLRHILSAILVILSGTVLHAYARVTAVYTHGINQTELYYGAIQILFLCFFFWAAPAVSEKHHALYRRVAELSSVYVGVRFVLHFFSLVYFDEMFWLIIPVVIFMSAYIVWDYVTVTRETMEPSWKLQLFGLLASQSFTMASYLLQTGIFGDLQIGSQMGIAWKDILMSVGMMMFPLCQLFNYLQFSTESFRRNEEYDDLTRVAYEDVLTHLPNRAFLERTIAEMEKRQENYFVISIDLNDLKKTNDTYGHDAGDQLLRNFAETLKKTFEREAFCSRIGGDEFLVLYRKNSVSRLKELLANLDKGLEQRNRRESHLWKYHAAYGYAERLESKSFHETMLLADRRMYEMKRKMKERQS